MFQSKSIENAYLKAGDYFIKPKSSRPEASVKMVFLEISQNSQEKNTGVSYEFCEISKNTFYYRTSLVAASVKHVSLSNKELF